MKNIYKFAIVISLLSVQHSYAQIHDNYDFLEINNMKIPLFARGNLFRPGKIESHVAEMPTGTNINTLFQQNLWIAGIDQNNELRLAAHTNENTGLSAIDYAIGPVSSANYQEDFSKYNHVWKVSKAEIASHIANYNSSDYSIHEDILNWPAHGDIEYGEAYHLAPFVDVNANGIYEPELGDYPEIRGDQALFAMFNDARYQHNASSGQKLYAEIHVMLYGYDSPGVDYLDNSFFVHYEIYNRSENLTFNDIYVSQFLNFELGYFNDDFIGTHVTKNIAYVYNGDSFDNHTSTHLGYGDKPPVFGWALLNQDYASTRLISFDLSPKIGWPQTQQARFNIMQGLNNDGTALNYGYFGTMGNQPTKFIYPGNSNPLFTEEWSEITIGSIPSYRQMIASTVSHDFGPGDKICLDYAGVFSRDYTSNIQHQLNHLFADVDGVQNIYNYENFNCLNAPLSINETNNNTKLTMFASNIELTINRQEGYNKDVDLTIVNAMGQSVMHESMTPSETEKIIDINKLPTGVYFIPNYAFKFIKQ